MKSFISTVVFSILVATSLVGCKPAEKNERSTLSVSIEPQKYFLEAIVGDKFLVNVAIPSGANPETYDPSPSQMVNIGKSEMYFKVGEMGFENTWLNNILANNEKMLLIDCSIGVDHIADEGHHGEDPHIWSSPKTVSIIAKNMYNGLVKHDPENKEYYQDQYAQLEKSIQKTDSIIRSHLDNSSTKSFIIYHPALSYFAQEYSLNQLTIEVDGKSPSPKELASLIEKGKENGVNVIFLQEEYDEKNVEVIAKELNAKIVRINPLAYSWDEELIKIAKAIAQNDGK